ncbi:hypothetical protein GUJ93_ZPchr0010g8550 [Zizania palustris]|nr:hypothetical protein GUJ93_ZPchr0010g8550 [Zizania palustris]KAG8085850.1 hypothetical protein GUJ93_ZPchr0010g8550 [Zizania palustris]KAG8085851.1 hypothetical protein GUJ93_ZPchr0010g8550 [Zizania palustris]
MGRKAKWFDAVQRALSTGEPDPEDEERKAKRSMDKSNLKKIWKFSRSTSAAPETALPPAAQQPHHDPSPAQPDRQQDTGIREAETSSPVAAAGDAAAAAQAAAAVAIRPTDTAPRTPARSAEELAALKIQAACRSYLARRAHQARGLDRLMSLVVGGIAAKRQTEDALYCMQTMTRVQTQIYSRRMKTEEDKKALKSQVHVKQGIDKTKIVAEGWDHGHQSKEQMEAVLTVKQEAASRRQRALAYAFANQWSNRKPSSARAAPPPMFMDTGNPNWGWSWAERWMAAARPWESQTTPDSSRAPGKAARGRTRVAMSVQIPTTPGRFARPPSCPSPSTPTPRSPSVSGRTSVVPASPRASPLHRSEGDLRRTTSLQYERPRSSQERPAGSRSPLHGGKGACSLRRTASVRSGELPRLSLGGAAPALALARDDDVSAPATPSYMQTTKAVRAKARPTALELPDRAAPDQQVPSPSVIKKRLALALADKPSASSPSKAKAEGSTRRSQPPSPRF